MAFAFRELRLIAEGGGATALAALLADRWRPRGPSEGPVVVVVSGGNVALPTLRSVLEAPRAT
jgi:threonine dehydratase